jgi:hypothetical protein
MRYIRGIIDVIILMIVFLAIKSFNLLTKNNREKLIKRLIRDFK